MISNPIHQHLVYLLAKRFASTDIVITPHIIDVVVIIIIIIILFIRLRYCRLNTREIMIRKVYIA